MVSTTEMVWKMSYLLSSVFHTQSFGAKLDAVSSEVLSGFAAESVQNINKYQKLVLQILTLLHRPWLSLWKIPRGKVGIWRRCL